MVGERSDSGDDAAWAPPPLRAQSAGESLEGYVDLVEIGRGGDSVVFRARQVSLNRDVAIKVLLLDDDETLARFEREIEITVDLGRQHPNIMSVLATGTTTSGRPAIVMDLYERGSLDQRLRETGPFPAADVVDIGCVLADALQFAHEHGVLHRDVKPQNVMILPTSYVLGDFGIARLVDSEHTASAERFTVRHASPQILDGHPPTASDDVWSLGSTLFTLLDGRTPFASSEPGEDTALAYLRRARTEPHRRLPDTVDAALVSVIDRALAKDPEHRWSDAASMRAALEELRGRHLAVWSPERSPGTSAGSVDSETRPRQTPTPVEPAAPAVAPSEVRPEVAAAAPEPAPVALSVLAHEAEAAPHDAEPTGVVGSRAVESGTPAPGDHPDYGEPPPGPVDDRGAPADERRGPGRIVLALAAVALAVGVTLGALGGILRGDDDTGSGAQDQSTSPQTGIETLDAPPVGQGDDQPLEVDNSIRPVFKNLVSHGTSIELTWVDRSGGEASRFVVSQSVPEVVHIQDLDPETTSYTVEGVDPDARRTCYVVTAVMPDGRAGASDARCWPPGGGQD